MKSVARGAITLLMLLGLYAGVIQTSKHNVSIAHGGPAPMCDPSAPGCPPPIPPQ